MDMHPISSLAYFLDKGRAVILLLGGIGCCVGVLKSHVLGLCKNGGKIVLLSPFAEFN